ncbi:MAG: hypothetical protein L0216_07725 [Planctomycetales bacterium]|nr:hypothetical protein [Planctomycetales bacterium]
MRTGAVLGAVGLVVALGVAGGAAFYLHRTGAAVQRAVDPVGVAAPDLYPADTLAFLAVHGLDRSYASAEAWWRKFEGTAAFLALRRAWEGDRKQVPPVVSENLAAIEKEMARAEARFGSRPTTRDFFETYGRYTAVGLVPPEPGGSRPRLLAVVRLPGEGAATALRSHLEKAPEVRRGETAAGHAYPVFTEERADLGPVHYGVGGGFLFLSDAAGPLDAALDRLAVAADPKGPGRPAGALSEDPILKRVTPARWEDLRVAVYLKRAIKLSSWSPGLEALDRVVEEAFVLAPQDPAVAFAVNGSGDGAGRLRSSFAIGVPKPWTEALPAGLAQFQLQVPLPETTIRKALEPGLSRFLGKALWKEAEALLADPARVKRLLREAIPAEAGLDDELVARVPNDLRLLGELARGAAESVLYAPASGFAMAVKAYPAPDGSRSGETVYALDAGPDVVFVVATLLEGLRAQLADRSLPRAAPGGGALEDSNSWIVRESRPGALLWRANMERMREELGEKGKPGGPDTPMGFLREYIPGVLLAGGRLYFCLGPGILEEIARLHDPSLAGPGAPAPLSSDPVFAEALKAVPEGFQTLDYTRPAEWLEAISAGYRSVLESAAGSFGSRNPQEAETLRAVLGTADEVLRWVGRTRCEVSATYVEPERPSIRVSLLDPAAAGRGPELELAAAPSKAPGLLPAETWGLTLVRLDLGAAVAAVREAFLKRWPGGEAGWKKEGVRLDADPALVDAVVERLLKNQRGELGIAVALPKVPPESRELRGPQDAIVRAPGIVLFAEFRDADAAFAAVRLLLERLQADLNPRPFEERHRVFLRSGGRGEPPAGSMLTVGTVGPHPALALDLYLPVGGTEYAVPSLCVLERDGLLFLTNSVGTFQAIAAAQPGAEGTLAARLAAELPAGSLPGATSRLTLLRTDGFLAEARLYLEALVPMALGFSLGGYSERPPEERIQAHERGWTRFLDLLLDACSTSSWGVGASVQEGDRVRSTWLSIPDRKR